MRRSLPEQVLDHLGPQIVAGTIAPGEIIRLEEVEKRFDVSRTVAREAIKTLETNGLVASRRRVGAEVLPPERWAISSRLVIGWSLSGPGRLAMLHSLSELRAGMEPLAARLAAERVDRQTLAELRDAMDRMVEAAAVPDLETFLKHDIAFHAAILRGAQNPFMTTFVPVIEEVLAARTHHHLMPPSPNPDAMQWHKRAVEAIERGDGDAAHEAMTAIVAEAQTGMDEMALITGELPVSGPVESSGKPS